MNFDKQLKLLSLLFTETISKCDLYEKDIDIMKTNINEDSINLYDLVKLFNNNHQLFKKRYRDLKKLDIGEDILPLRFYDNELIIYIKYPTIIDDDIGVLHAKRQNDGSILCTVTGYRNTETKEVDIDQETIKSYVDLFEKYNHIIRLYYEILNGYSISDKSHSISTIITNNTILDDIDYLFFSMRIENYFMPNTYFDLAVCPYDDNQRSCKVTINNTKVIGNSELCNYILKNIYISRKYLTMLKPEYGVKHKRGK